jgi:membrane protein
MSDTKEKLGLAEGWRRLVTFMRQDLWDVELSAFSGLRGIGVRLLRVISLVVKGFREDECTLFSSSLTYSTLMAIVPMLAISLALARGFGADAQAKEWVLKNVHEWTDTFETAAATALQASTAATGTNDTASAAVMADSLATQINGAVEMVFERVEGVSFGALGSIGLVLLMWTVVQVLGHVELAFNRVWGITQGRTLLRRFTDYLFMLVVLPFLIFAAASVPIVDIVVRLAGDGTTGEVVRSVAGSGFFKNLLVLSMTTLTFGIFIKMMPNGKVRLLPALAGGIVAASLFILWLFICARFQIAVSRLGKLYGSFAIVPIMIFWVHASWQIVLFAAEVAFATQNCTTFVMEGGAKRASFKACVAMATVILAEACRSMKSGGSGFQIAAYASKHAVSTRFIHDVTQRLTDMGYLTRDADLDETYVLKRDPATLKLSEVDQSLATMGSSAKSLGLRSGAGVDAAGAQTLAEYCG